MAAYGNLVLRDDTATPVDHTLKPSPSGEPRTMRWREALSNVPFDAQLEVVGGWELTKAGLRRVWISTALNALETIGSVSSSGYVAPPKVAAAGKVVTTFYLPNRFSQQNTADLLRMHTHLLAGANATAAGGYDPKGATGGMYVAGSYPLHEAVVLGILPS